MVSYLVGIFGVGVSIYLGFIFESTAFFLLAFLLVVMGVFSFLYLQTKIRQIKATLEIPILVAERNTFFALRLRLDSGKGLGFGKVCACVQYKNTLEERGKQKKLNISGISPGTSDYEFSVKLLKAGNYEFLLRKIRLYDPFGLFFRELKIGQAANALMLPEIKPVEVRLGEEVYHFYQDADVYDELRPGFDPSESFGVREFRNGDKLSRVHWKLSAKQEQPMIREYSLPRACPAVLFLDSNDVGEEAMLNLAAGLSFTLLDQGCPHYLVWYSSSREEVLRTRVDDEESYYQGFVAFLQDRVKKGHPDIMERYAEKYRNESAVYKILFQGGTCSGDLPRGSGLETDEKQNN